MPIWACQNPPESNAWQSLCFLVWSILYLLYFVPYLLCSVLLMTWLSLRSTIFTLNSMFLHPDPLLLTSFSINCILLINTEFIYHVFWKSQSLAKQDVPTQGNIIHWTVITFFSHFDLLGDKNSIFYLHHEIVEYFLEHSRFFKKMYWMNGSKTIYKCQVRWSLLFLTL